ncbi:hypothetical protein JCM8208_006007 [Rhodotorula glutinis]
MDWSEAGQLLLPVPWSSFDGLLVKVISKDGQLSLMATDLETVYFESLTPRQLNRRLEDALGTLNAQSQSQTQSEGIMVGIGDEGERLLRESVAALVAAVADGSATVEISHEAFEHIVSITVPSSFTLRFLTTSLEHQSSPALAAHLVTPLLGVCSSLLALLRDASTDDADLLRRVETAIDGSGQAERMQEGRAARRFMGVGGPALLGRWVQRSLGAKEKDLQPVTLSLPTRSSTRLFSPTTSTTASQAAAPAHPSPTKRRRSPSPSLASPSPSPSPSFAKRAPLPSFASRMLDHRGVASAGERVAWDDSQSQAQALGAESLAESLPLPSAAQAPSSAHGDEDEQERGGSRGRRGAGTTDEGEPSTDDEVAPARAAPSPTPTPTPAHAGAEDDDATQRAAAAAASKRAAAQAEKDLERERRRARLRQLEVSASAAGEAGQRDKKKKAKARKLL